MPLPTDAALATPPSGQSIDPTAAFAAARRLQPDPGPVSANAPPAADQALSAAREAMDEFHKSAPQPQQSDPAQAWGSMAMAVAALGGLLTHAPMTTAFNSMAGVLNAYKEGDQAKAQQEFQRWQVAHDAAGKLADLEMKSYAEILKMSDPRRQLAAFQAQAAAFKNQAIMDAANSGDTETVYRLVGAHYAATNKLTKSGEELNVANQRIEADDLSHPDMPQQERLNRHALILQGKNPDDPGGGVAAKAEADAEAVAKVNLKKQRGETVTPEEQRAAEEGQSRIAARTNVRVTETGEKHKITSEGSKNTERQTVFDEYKSLHPDISDADTWKTVDRDIALATKGSTPEDMKDTAKMIASYQAPPLSGFAMATGVGEQVMGEVRRLNPEYQASRYDEVHKAMVAFGAGSQGNQVRFLNVGTQHLDVMSGAAAALNNGNYTDFNRLIQEYNKRTGESEPTTFDGLKHIVSTEIQKAVAGGIGAQADREQLEDSLSKANSPRQLADVIEGYKKLMAGQAMGLKKQYEDATGFKSGQFSFENKLLPATIKALGNLNDSGDAAHPPLDSGRPAGVPPGARQDKYGRWLIKHGNDWYVVKLPGGGDAGR